MPRLLRQQGRGDRAASPALGSLRRASPPAPASRRQQAPAAGAVGSQLPGLPEAMPEQLRGFSGRAGTAFGPAMWGLSEGGYEMQLVSGGRITQSLSVNDSLPEPLFYITP